MNRRMRSSERCAACSDSSWAWKAVSIWLSIALSEWPRLPISVRGSRSGMRWFRCPLAIWLAVSSMSLSGRRLACTTRDADGGEDDQDDRAAHDQVEEDEPVGQRADVAEVYGDDEG